MNRCSPSAVISINKENQKILAKTRGVYLKKENVKMGKKCLKKTTTKNYKPKVQNSSPFPKTPNRNFSYPNQKHSEGRETMFKTKLVEKCTNILPKKVQCIVAFMNLISQCWQF